MAVTPDCAACQFVKNFGPGFWVGFGGKFIPEVFYQLQTLEPAQMFNGLKCGFHG